MSDRLSSDLMADELDKLVYSKLSWVSDFEAKRPGHEVEIKRRELAVLRQAASDYRAAHERDKRKAG